MSSIKFLHKDRPMLLTIPSYLLLDPAERWLGALYDWEQMTWKWAASGKPLSFQAFGEKTIDDKEQLRWHCIILDPRLQYRFV